MFEAQRAISLLFVVIAADAELEHGVSVAVDVATLGEVAGNEAVAVVLNHEAVLGTRLDWVFEVGLYCRLIRFPILNFYTSDSS